ncbi:MAG: glycosyltransferase [Fibromonadaceae bacterium]|jgi:glycosyltransferase involved in cell wall biosynthesis|nr:glycosyltransferase [Fibromonadaceae bacterium]
MKILLISYSDAVGGAFIAAKRLLDAMLATGVDAKMGVVEKRTNSEAVFELPKNKNFEQQNAKRNKKNMLQTTNPILHSINKLSKIDVNYINQSDFDIVNLHWIAASTISIEDIAKIKKPIVWTMHDSWLFCGAEHYPNVLENDNRFEQGYFKNNFPASSSGIDICRQTWERKRKAWKKCNFNFISPSNYEAQCLNKSMLFKGKIATVIPNAHPANFKPMLLQARNTFKKILGIPLDKRIIGFGAAHVISNGKSVKGELLLLNALKKLKNKKKYFAVVFGASDNKFSQMLPITSFSAGKILDINLLCAIYNLLDVFVCPSTIENLPNVCLEAMFCGVPVAAFKTGGIPDIVEHKKNGYLAKSFIVNDLVKGLEFCLANQKELSKNSLEKAKSNYFSEKEIVRKYLEVYKET